ATIEIDVRVASEVPELAVIDPDLFEHAFHGVDLPSGYRDAWKVDRKPVARCARNARGVIRQRLGQSDVRACRATGQILHSRPTELAGLDHQHEVYAHGDVSLDPEVTRRIGHGARKHGPEVLGLVRAPIAARPSSGDTRWDRRELVHLGCAQD